MISPTGKGVRGIDKWGSGAFHSSRGKGKTHKGLDFIADPGQDVVAPCAGRVRREAQVYADTTEYMGLVIVSDDLHHVKLFYVLPAPGVVGTLVDEGEVIGTVQDLDRRYPGITPHVHMEVRCSTGEIVDPGTLIKA